jgi:hypothetical protein
MEIYISNKTIAYKKAIEIDGYSTPEEWGKSLSPLRGLTFSESDIGPSYSFMSPNPARRAVQEGRAMLEIGGSSHAVLFT